MIQQIMKPISPWHSTTSNSYLTGTIYIVSSIHIAYTVHNDAQHKWIIDLGDTDHIVAHVYMLDNPKPLSSVLHLHNW